MSTLLELKGVVAGYGSGPDILRGIDLTVQSGQIQCIIGPNGAGKSTLLKVISGMLKPRDGEVLFQGNPIHHLRPDQVLSRGICFVPQERSLFPDMTVKENLRMGGYIRRNARETEQHIEQVFEQFPILGRYIRRYARGTEMRIEQVFEQFPILREKQRQPARELSGGQQQILAMGRALVSQPEVILLDEPSLGLAPLIVEQVFEIIKQFKETGITVLLVEQNAHKGLEYSDWGCVLDLGKMLFENHAHAILDDPRIQALYLGTSK